MPWCDQCERYRAPSAMTSDGRCPTCGLDLDPPERVGAGAQDGADGVNELDHDHDKAPWHFKLLVVACVAYLGWRFFEIFFA